MRILVTGAAGFIGSNLALELQKRHADAEIVALDSFTEGSFENLAGFRGDVVCADMADPAWTLAVADEPFDRIYHLAAISDQRVTDQRAMLRSNVEAFRVLLEFACETRTPIVYASSASTYGLRQGVMKESDEPAPATVYAFSKRVMDNIARIHSAKFDGWRLIGLRYFNVYGPREAHKGVPASMIYHLSKQMVEGKRPRIFEFGEHKRDFVYVADAVSGTIAAMEKARGSGVYNIGSGIARTFNEMVAILNDVLKTKLEPDYFPCPFKDSYQAFTQADLAKSRKDFGYQPAYTFEQGIAAYMKWLYPER